MTLYPTTKTLPVLQNLPYDDISPNQVVDLYRPDNGKTNRPLIVWIHGGGWMTNTEDTSPILPVYFNFVQRGFAVASVRYRLSSEATWPAQIIDVKAALRYLRAHSAAFGLFSEPGLWGASSGAHLAMMCATNNGPSKFDIGSYEHTTSRVRVVMADYGPCDLAALADAPYSGPAPSPATMVTNLLGAPAASVPNLAADASPLYWVSPATAPVFMVHGTADRLCPFAQSQAMDAALASAGVQHLLVPAPNKGHGDLSIYTTDWLNGVSDLFRDSLQ